MNLVLFTIAAAVAVIAATLVVVQRNPMYSALYLIVTLFCLALLYLQLGAQFLSIIQVIVYAGAIMVLFLFVVMLLNQDKPIEAGTTLRLQNPAAAFVGLLLLLELISITTLARIPIQVTAASTSGTLGLPGTPAVPGTVESVAEALFTRYLFPFELTSVILLVGMIGVVVLAKRKV